MKKTAFTLTEILISLGIIGVMMALSISIVKPREIQYKYQFQQAQRTLTESLREAVLRTEYTHHRFPKETINGVHPIMQLCKGLNETLNTTTVTANMPSVAPAHFGDASVNSAYKGCKIQMLTGMTFYIWAPGSTGHGLPICRRHFIHEKDDQGELKKDANGNLITIAEVPVAAYIAFVDLDGKGKFYDPNKKVDVPAYAKERVLGNLPAFFLDEDYTARPVPSGYDITTNYNTSVCGF